MTMLTVCVPGGSTRQIIGRGKFFGFSLRSLCVKTNPGFDWKRDLFYHTVKYLTLPRSSGTLVTSERDGSPSGLHDSLKQQQQQPQRKRPQGRQLTFTHTYTNTNTRRSVINNEFFRRNDRKTHHLQGNGRTWRQRHVGRNDHGRPAESR